MKIIFAGTPDFAAGFLNALIGTEHEIVAVITQPDKPGKRGKSLIPSPVKAAAVAAGIPILQPKKLTLDDLRAIPCDLMVVVAFGQILKPAVLEFPAKGCINVHTSLLPRWRGAAPVQRAILAGDTETGVTLIQMDSGLDTGNMLAKAAVPISNSDTASSLFDKLSDIGHPLLINTLEQIGSGNAQGTPQDDSLSTYAPKIDKSEAMINWQSDAISINRHIRAFNPDPGAYSFLSDKRVRIHETEIIENIEEDVGAGDVHAPGELVSLTKRGLLVSCGKGKLLIRRLQLPLGKGSILTGADMLNGYTEHLAIGQRFASL